MKEYYELLGLNENATIDEAQRAFDTKAAELYTKRLNSTIDVKDYRDQYDALSIALRKVAENIKVKATSSRTVENQGSTTYEDVRGTGEPVPGYTFQPNSNKKKGKGILVTAGCVVAAAVLAWYVRGNIDDNKLMMSTAASHTGSSIETEVETEELKEKTKGSVREELEAAMAEDGVTFDEDQAVEETQEVEETQVEETQEENKGNNQLLRILNELAERNNTDEVIAAEEAPVETAEVTPEVIEEVPVQEEVPVGAPEVTPEVVEENPFVEVEESQEEVQDYSGKVYNIEYGDVMDDNLVTARAQELVDQLNAAGINNPKTDMPYEVDHIKRIIKFLNGVLIPDSQEEIDLLYFDALDLTTAQMNTDYYLWHMNHATGECGDDFLQLIKDEAPNATHVTFGEALTKYDGNGVWPLIQWIQEKRIESFSTTSRDEKDNIMKEVYQELADIMKGDGATITIYDGKDAKEGITYTFTHNQILANPAAAFLLMQEAKYILIDCSIYDPYFTFDVYYSLNTNGVDENGYPVNDPDEVPLIEMEENYNNGCYDSISQFVDEINTQEIDQLWPDGKTFAQITQMKIEGEALNNYHMAHDSNKLIK